MPKRNTNITPSHRALLRLSNVRFCLFEQERTKLINVKLEDLKRLALVLCFSQVSLRRYLPLNVGGLLQSTSTQAFDKS